MQGKKAASIIASMIGMCFLLYLLLPDFNRSIVEREKTANSVIAESEIERYLGNSVIEEEQLEEENDQVKPITEQIKDKVREVVEITMDLVKKDQKIVAIGDSLTQGVGDETENGGYVGILNHTFEDHNLKLTVENFGKRGNRTDQLLKRLDEEEIMIAIQEADIILLTIGANDIMKVVQNHFTNLTIEPFLEEKVSFIERLTSILNKMNELNPDAQIFLIGFYNPFEGYFSEIEQLEMIVNGWNDAALSVTEDFSNVYYIPTKDLFMNSDLDLLADDHFHPNTNGYKLVARRVLEYLMKFSEEMDITKEKIES